MPTPCACRVDWCSRESHGPSSSDGAGTHFFSVVCTSKLLVSYCRVDLLMFLQQKVVLKVLAMTDERTKRKAMEAVADIYGTFFLT